VNGDFDNYGNFFGEIPAACVKDCSASGDVTEAVTYWQRRLRFMPPRSLMKTYLGEFGAWDDLNGADDETLARRVLWVACCDLKEDGRWFGLVH
jgi:hypothetical protein